MSHDGFAVLRDPLNTRHISHVAPFFPFEFIKQHGRSSRVDNGKLSPTPPPLFLKSGSQSKLLLLRLTDRTFPPLSSIGQAQEVQPQTGSPQKGKSMNAQFRVCRPPYSLTVLQKEPLQTTFSCLFCNHENCVIVKLDKKLGLGNLSCKICGQRFQTGINCENIFHFCGWSIRTSTNQLRSWL